ncbi:MAG: IS5/IS1182 family transposase, partial [Pseudomonadota bacterium]
MGYRPGRLPPPKIAIPVFSDRSRLCIDREFGCILDATATAEPGADGRQPLHVIRPGTAGAGVRAYSACGSQTTERWLADRIHQRKP